MRMMEKMGMQVSEIEGAKEVIIITGKKRIIIEDPNVSAVALQGQQIYQIMGGKQREEPLVRPDVVSDQDAQLVSEQAGVTIEEAKVALKAAEGDLAKAIVELKKNVAATS